MPTYIFLWNSIPFPPSPRLRLNGQIRARHLLQSAPPQSREGLGWGVHCFVRCSSVLSGCTDYSHCESSAKAYPELVPELSRPFLFQPVTAHVPFSFLLLTFAVWISDFLCSDDYNWGTVLRHSDVPDSTQTLCGFIFLTGFIYS